MDSANSPSRRIAVTIDSPRSCPAAGVCRAEVSDGISHAATDSTRSTDERPGPAVPGTAGSRAAGRRRRRPARARAARSPAPTRPARRPRRRRARPAGRRCRRTAPAGSPGRTGRRRSPRRPAGRRGRRRRGRRGWPAGRARPPPARNGTTDGRDTSRAPPAARVATAQPPISCRSPRLSPAGPVAGAVGLRVLPHRVHAAQSSGRSRGRYLTTSPPRPAGRGPPT